MNKKRLKKVKHDKGSLLANTKTFWLVVALFSVTLASFATSTLAWFNVSDALVVDRINIGYKQAEFAVGLKNKSDEKVTLFENGLSLSDLNNNDLYSSAKKNDSLYPCTTSYGSSWMKDADAASSLPTFRSAYAYPGYNLQTYDADFGYCQYEMYFYSDRSTYVFLDSSTTVSVESGSSDVTAASRLSFYSDLGYTIYSPKKSGTTLFGGRLNVAGSDDYFDSNNGKEVLYGEYNSDTCTLIYDEEARSSSGEAGNPFKAKTADNVEALDISKSISQGNLVIAEEESYSLSDLAAPTYAVTSSSHPIAYIPSTGYARVVMSLYLEGWDLHCIDKIQGTRFNLNVVFGGIAQPKISK